MYILDFAEQLFIQLSLLSFIAFIAIMVYILASISPQYFKVKTKLIKYCIFIFQEFITYILSSLLALGLHYEAEITLKIHVALFLILTFANYFGIEWGMKIIKNNIKFPLPTSENY